MNLKIEGVVFCQPRFVRAAGLGNRLFVWARAVIYAEENGWIMVNPKWGVIRRGALFRGGVDYGKSIRKIWLFDNFKHGKYLHGFDKSKLFFQVYLSRLLKSVDSSVVLKFIEGEGGQFRELATHHELISASLSSITKKKWQDEANKILEVPIVLNIRTGKDFKTANTEKEYFTDGALLTPLSWFKDILQLIRIHAGYDVPAYVVSEGPDNVLGEILDQNAVARYRGQSAISDLIFTSRASVIIGSGGSSFTAWASFLGQSPVITHPGQSLTWFGLSESTQGAFTIDPHEPDKEIIQIIVSRLKNEYF